MTQNGIYNLNYRLGELQDFLNPEEVLEDLVCEIRELMLEINFNKTEMEDHQRSIMFLEKEVCSIEKALKNCHLQYEVFYQCLPLEERLSRIKHKNQGVLFSN